MVRKVIQDIVVAKRTKKQEGRNSAPPFGSREKSRRVVSGNSRPKGSDRVSGSPVKSPLSAPRRSYAHRFLLGITIFALALFFIAILSLFERATVTVVPEQRTEIIDTVITAARGDAVGDISFELVELSDSEEKRVEASEVKEVQQRSSGTIVVYNDFNQVSSQRLIKNTRFETPEGLIFRIRESIVVPGQKEVNGEIIPGSVEAVVYAEEPGEKYNIGRVDFTIPGFEGTPRFEGFYARAKTEMAGGFSGQVKTISEDEAGRVGADLRSTLTENLLAQAQDQVPEEFVLFRDGIFIEFEEIEPPKQDDAKRDSVLIRREAVLYGIIFDKLELSNYLSRKFIPDLAPRENISIRNIDDLSFKILDKEDVTPPSISLITFTLEGEAQFVWIFDEEKLRQRLLSRPKTDIHAILSEFPSIVEAEVALRPFWKRSFPENGEDVKIREKLGSLEGDSQ